MSLKVVIDDFGVGNAIAVLKEKQLVDFFIDPVKEEDFFQSGAILAVKVLRSVKKLGGYFVLLPNNKKGFLRTKKSYKDGDLIRVQAKVYSDQEKPQRFSDNIKIMNKYFLLMKGNKKIYFSKNYREDNFKGPIEAMIYNIIDNISLPLDIIVRRNALHTESKILEGSLLTAIAIIEEIITFNINKPAVLYEGIFAKDNYENNYEVSSGCMKIEEQGSFERLGIWDLVKKSMSKKIFFHGDCYLIIEKTSVFWSIDVNSGNKLNVSSQNINLAAVEEIKVLLKVLGIEGKIIIDFISVSRSEKAKLLKFFKDQFRDEYSKTSILGWTRGNNFEVERVADRTPLKFILDNENK